MYFGALKTKRVQRGLNQPKIGRELIEDKKMGKSG